MFKCIIFAIASSGLFFTACKIVPEIIPWSSCKDQASFQNHVRSIDSGGVIVAEVKYFSDGSAPFTVAYTYTIDDEEFHQSKIVVSGHNNNYFVPEGGKYLMSYDIKRPKWSGYSRHSFALNQPIYDSTQIFKKAIAEVKRAFFIEQRGVFFYGGLQLIFSYNVDGKEYISHNGINLCEVYPNIKNPADSLNFVWRKFEVEYDINNPYISRILLDKEVEPKRTHDSNIEKILSQGESWKKGTTLMGYSYAKCARNNPSLWGELNEDKSKWHEEAEKHFFELMDSPKAFSCKIKPDGREYLERKLSDGRGIRLYADKTFMEFFDW